MEKFRFKEGILPGALVRCSDDTNQSYKTVYKNGLYSVEGTLLKGAFVYLTGLNGFYNRDRFTLIYNPPDDFVSDFECEGIC